MDSVFHSALKNVLWVFSLENIVGEIFKNKNTELNRNLFIGQAKSRIMM
jgi:hypothetical protein